MMWLKNKISLIQTQYMEAIEACIRRTEAAYAQELLVVGQQLQAEYERNGVEEARLLTSCGHNSTQANSGHGSTQENSGECDADSGLERIYD